MSRLTDGVRTVAEAILASADDLNVLDGQAGDGDLGATMTIGARSVIALLPELGGQAPADVLRSCGSALARDAPSTSGTLVATGLLRAAREVGEGSEAGVVHRCLDAAFAGIAERGGAERGSKTMLDALGPAAEAAGESDGSLANALAAAARAADDGARKTVEMVPRYGRAGWLADRSAGHEDAGARLVAIILASAATAAAENTDA